MATILNNVSSLLSDSKQIRSDKDLELWKIWKKNPTETNLSSLLLQIDPLVQQEVNKWAGVLARPILEAEARRLAVMGIESYEPNRGAAVATHISNYLKKLSRLSYTHQSLARLPENKRLQYHTYEVGRTFLEDKLGRAPANDELADHLGWSTNYLAKFQKETVHKEYLESGPVVPGFEAEEHDTIIDLVHHDLAPVQKQIMEHLTGYNNTPILSHTGIMKKLNLTQGQYSYQKKLIEQAFLKAGK